MQDPCGDVRPIGSDQSAKTNLAEGEGIEQRPESARTVQQVSTAEHGVINRCWLPRSPAALASSAYAAPRP